ncbi:MAG: CocE/NonD family hydrolase [Proteobacteria bacterium]|nr:CocE/NonD family hydrolase [Pseudomonadota bacterium]
MRLFWVLALLVGCSNHHMPEPSAKAGKRFAESMALSDGTELHTRVFLPKGEGPWPVIFMRVPYPMGPVLNGRCRIFNRHGYACAFQDERGRGKSEGEWLPFENEGPDGLEALAWVEKQPWCDGNIGMMGESYLGASAWAVAHTPPESLKTIVPIVIGTELYDMAYEGGLFRHDLLTAWMGLMPSDHDFRYLSGSRRYHRALRHRPRLSMDEASAGESIEWFKPWLHATDPADPFWNRPIVLAATEIPEVTPLPILSMGGWSDAFTGPQLDTWQALGTKSESHWVIGPWNHLTQVAADVRQHGLRDDVGLAATYQQWPRLLDWMDHHLKGEPLQYPTGGVTTYVVNGGGWVHRDAWPPPTEDLVLRPVDGVDAQRCEGVLSQIGGAGEAGFVYDPAKPTPSHGGAGVLAGSFPLWRGSEPGFLSQGKLCERRDDLIGFRSEPLVEPLHVAGRLQATVAFASEAPDTAINVRFLEERANGRRIHVRESILALSHRDGHGNATYTPGDVLALELETWPVEYVFEAGSRVLVEFGSASFPKYEAHSNTTVPWAQAVETVPASQRVIFEGTEVRLPVLSE